MLKRVYIKNFAIIQECDLEFLNGMIVLTGETGAGKSIIIDAIELVLGQRASGDVVRVDAERADICVTFDIGSIEGAIQFLRDHELDNEEECLIRRVIYQDGRSKSSINGIPVTQQILREFSAWLIDIHGQHEFQTVLKRDHQRYLLDNFAHHEVLLKTTKEIYAKWRKTKDELTILIQTHQDIQAKTEFLTYQVQELDALNLGENEITEINQEYRQLANADLLLGNCQMAINAIENDSQDNISAMSALNKAYQSIAALGELNPFLQNIAESINGIIIQTREASQDLRFLFEKIDLNPERLSFLESRLNTIYDLAKRHRVNPEEIPIIHKQKKAELDQLKNNDERLQMLQQEIEQLEKEYEKIANQLSKSRQKIAKKLSQAITKHIQSMGMPGGKLEISLEALETDEPNSYGKEKVLFLVSTNPGQPLKPLTQVVSGGELSRISLAIQVITAQDDKTPTLIFDEIDVGVGGAIAEIIGRLLSDLGKITQVFCITHLPQVAACGHHHFQVEKKSDQSTTDTAMHYLTPEQRIQEIARMLGGLKITDQTLAHAKEMLGM